ncbi:creatininase family protein [Novosphingobium rosa]|uniref:creatininase family protein n=1 Tax=Novosphingobium rosa TaxID=76978 RepID=UPI000835D545|nr:creatininase family protein [Novosphingobium rosa]
MKTILIAALALCAASPAMAGSNPYWEEMTGADFARAIKEAQGVCVLPMGSVEKFGPSGPMGTNLFMARAVAGEAAKKEFFVIFPAYYVAQTTDVANHLGTINYSPKLQYDMLAETVSEMGRNGCTRIVLSNGHSSNMGLIQWFIQSTLHEPHPYSVYATYPAPPRMSPPTPENAKLPAAMQPSKPDADGHGGEERVALMMAIRPDLVHPERAHDDPVVPEGSIHLPLPAGVLAAPTRFIEAPTSYLGDASGASAGRGKALLGYAADRLVTVIRAIKADQTIPEAEKAFAQQRAHPK